MDQLRAMRTFVRVVDEKSFAGAARALGLAPAVVTRDVAELEAQLGARLITRTTRRLALTPIGSRYLERTRAILADIAEAAALASAAQAEARGTVRLRAAPPVAAHVVAPRLAEFQSRWPGITIELLADAEVDAVDDEADLTLLERRTPLDGGFVARPVLHSELVVCASPGWSEPRSPEGLAALPLLGGPEGALNFVDRADGRALTVTAACRPARGASPDAALVFALSGAGAALLPGYAAAAALRSGRLLRWWPGWRLPSLTVWACLPSRRHLPAATRAVFDFVIARHAEGDGVPRPPTTAASPTFLEEMP